MARKVLAVSIIKPELQDSGFFLFNIAVSAFFENPTHRMC